MQLTVKTLVVQAIVSVPGLFQGLKFLFLWLKPPVAHKHNTYTADFGLLHLLVAAIDTKNVPATLS